VANLTGEEINRAANPAKIFASGKIMDVTTESQYYLSHWQPMFNQT
jgi:hypothetical protein